MEPKNGKSKCVRCLAEISLEEFLENDHVCALCAGRNDFPLASTDGVHMMEEKAKEHDGH